jgi:hypothetical protein
LKKSIKIVLANVFVNVVISILFAISLGPANGSMMDRGSIFLIALGTISLILGAMNFLIALILIAVENKEWMQAFFIASGVLLLIGLGVCGPMLMFSAM